MCYNWTYLPNNQDSVHSECIGEILNVLLISFHQEVSQRCFVNLIADIMYPSNPYLQEFSDMLHGNSMKDALRILHYELDSTIQRYEADKRHESWRASWQRLFLHHSNRNTAFHWPSALLILICALVLFISCALHPNRWVSWRVLLTGEMVSHVFTFSLYSDVWLALEGLLLLLLLGANLAFLAWDHHFRETEHLRKAKSLLAKLKSKPSLW